MEVTQKEIYDFIEEHGFRWLGADYYEDAGGHVWVVANIRDEIKQVKREPSAGELLAAIDPVTAHDLDALIAKAKKKNKKDLTRC